MATPADWVCARCGFRLEPEYRFCPGCSLPTSGDDVLSTQISQKREEAERRGRIADRRGRRVFGAGIALMLVFVAGLGLVLFNRDVLQLLLQGSQEPAVEKVEPRLLWEPEWVKIPAGTLTLLPLPDPAENEETEHPPDVEEIEQDYYMSRYEVPNSLWHRFLREREEDLREARVWSEAYPGEKGGWRRDDEGRPEPMADEADRPVRYVSPIVVAYFCEWLTERLRTPGWEIRPPTRVEWEYAARGSTTREYPWGNEFMSPPPVGAGPASTPKPPKNVDASRPAPVDAVDDDTSAVGVLALGTNVSEIVISSAPRNEERLVNLIEDRRIEVTRRGAAFGNTVEDARNFAKTWYANREIEPRLGFTLLGVRLVKARRIRTTPPR